jgi:hypothetical protein
MDQAEAGIAGIALIRKTGIARKQPGDSNRRVIEPLQLIY